MNELKRITFGNLIPKSMHGKSLNGIMFAGLVESYVSTINNGGVPTVATAWEDISDKECAYALDIAVQMYEENMDKSCTDMPLSTDDLVNAHEDALMAAMQFFESRAVGKNAG